MRIKMNNTVSEEIKNRLEKHSIRLITAKQALSLLLFCIESNWYYETVVELYSFGKILEEYLQNTYSEFQDISEAAGIIL